MASHRSLWFVLILLCSACSSADDGGFAGSGGSGGVGGSGGAGGSGGTGGTSAGFGLVLLRDTKQDLGGTPSRTAVATAEFHGGATMDTRCTVQQTFGPCVVRTCGSGTAGTASAGAITISGGRQPITLMPASAGGYTAFQDSSVGIFDGGETLHVMGAGAAVPAFSGSMVAPSQMTMTAPSSQTGSITLARSAGLSLAWSGASSGNVEITLTGASGPEVFCSFPASSGSGAISSSALGLLAAGDATLDAEQSSDTTVTAGGFHVALHAVTAARDADGFAFGMLVHLQ